MRSTQSLSINQVFNTAPHLFGHTASPEAPQEKPEILLPEGTIRAVHPYIDGQAFSQTMSNYRQYVAGYNARVKQENELINKHNAMVELYLAEAEVTEADRIFIGLFHKNYAATEKEYKRYNQKLSDRDYNDKVEEFCRERGHLVTKRRVATLKYQTELIFQQFLHMYSVQMRERTDRYLKYGITAGRPLQELEIRADKVTALMRDGVKSVAVCNKTIRNHRQRLEEAGVLTDYVFQGHVAGVRVQVNPQILAFTDAFKPLDAVTENQPVTPLRRKKLPYISKELSTQTVQNNCKISDDASQSSCDKELPAATGSLHYKNSFYKNTGSKEADFHQGGAAETVKVSKTSSEILREQIIHPQQLAMELAAGVYNNYVPIPMRDLYHEANKGTLTEAEFRELRIQDHFKAHAKIYRNASPYPGSWKIAINEWMDNRWLTANGRPFDKITIANYTEEYRWCIENARKWYLKTNVAPLYPGDYFDMTRKTKHEVGFEYQRTRYKRHMKGIADREVQQRKREKAAELRKIQGNDARRLKTEANRFLKGKITLQQLENYVKQHLPAQFLTDLPAYLTKRMNNL